MRSARPAREHGHRSRARRRGHGRRRQHDARPVERARLPAGRALPSEGRGGRAAPGREVLPHRLLRRAVRDLRRALRAARRTGRARPQGGALQLGRRGRGERGEVREGRDRPAGGDLLRGGVPRPHAAHDEPDQPAHAVQAGVRAVRRRGVSRAVQLPVPLRRPGRPAGAAGVRARARDDGRSAFRGRGHLRARAGRGRLHRAGRRVPAGDRGALSHARHPARSPTRSSRGSAARAGSWRASTSGSTPTS